MKLDLRKLAQELPPWDFVVELDGVSYPTRPLTEADYRFIAAMQAGQVEEASRVLAFADSLFPQAKPDLSALDAEVLSLLVGEMIQYGKQRVEQCRQKPAAAVPPPRGPLN